MCNKDLTLPAALKTSKAVVLSFGLYGVREEAVCTLDALVVSSGVFPQVEEIGTANSGGVFASVVPLPVRFECASFPRPPLKAHYFIKSKKKHNLEQQRAEPKLIV